MNLAMVFFSRRTCTTFKYGRMSSWSGCQDPVRLLDRWILRLPFYVTSPFVYPETQNFRTELSMYMDSLLPGSFVHFRIYLPNRREASLLRPVIGIEFQFSGKSRFSRDRRDRGSGSLKNRQVVSLKLKTQEVMK